MWQKPTARRQGPAVALRVQGESSSLLGGPETPPMASVRLEVEETALGDFKKGPSSGMAAEKPCSRMPGQEVSDVVDKGSELDTEGTVSMEEVLVEEGPGPPGRTGEDPSQGEEEDAGLDTSRAEAEQLLSHDEGGDMEERFVPTERQAGSSRTEGAPVGQAEARCQSTGLLEQKVGRGPLGSGHWETTMPPCCSEAEDLGGEEEEAECPICTEHYDQDSHRLAQLNCGHVLCGRCLHAIMEAASAAEIGRVCCPICRQKTPMMEWEICRLQEELLLLGATQGLAAGGGPFSPPLAAFFSPLPARQPGFWGGLEHHFQVRFHTTRMVGFLPCIRYPPRLIRSLARLEQRCPCGYRLALLALLAAECLSLLVVFLPIVLLLVLFLILER